MFNKSTLTDEDRKIVATTAKAVWLLVATAMRFGYAGVVFADDAAKAADKVGEHVERLLKELPS